MSAGPGVCDCSSYGGGALGCEAVAVAGQANGVLWCPEIREAYPLRW